MGGRHAGGGDPKGARTIATRDLTQGSIRRHLVALASPVFVAMLLQSTYALVDLAWVGRLGEQAVAALSISLQAFFIVLAIAQIIATTTLAEISQAYGAGKLDLARGLLSSFSGVAALIGAVAAASAWASASFYVGTFTADPEVFGLGVAYFEITALTFFVQVQLIVFGNALRASGDFTAPTRITVVSVAINFVLDPALIFGWGPLPELGLSGAAWATVIAQTVACLVYVRRLARRRGDRSLWWARPRWRRSFFARIASRGLPAGIQFFLLSAVLGIVLAAMKPHGPAWTAAAGGGFRVIQQVFLPLVALGSAAAAIAGQNLGAGRPERVAAAAHRALRWALVYALVSSVLLLFAGRIASHLFAKGDAQLDIGALYFQWSAPGLVALGLTYIPTFVLQAAGRAILTMAAAIVRVLLLWALVAWLLPALGLAPQWAFGAVTVTAFVEGGFDVLLLERFLTRIRRAPPVPRSAAKDA